MRVPKPPKSVKGERSRLRTRKRMKSCGKKKSAFPKQRDKQYTTWLTLDNRCLLAGHFLRRPITLKDTTAPGYAGRFWHVCWGPLDPAHVDEHRAQGAPDFAVTVPLCRAAHSFYDEHRDQWRLVTGYSKAKMASAASGYALKYVELGGTPAKETQ